MRLIVADILDGLALDSPGVERLADFAADMKQRWRRQRGADMLRWEERHDYGEPMPADEYQAALDELGAQHEEAIEQAVEGVRDENERLRKEAADLRDVISKARDILRDATS